MTHSMSDPWALPALVATGFAAGFINIVAGGGSLLTVPLLIFLGLPEGTANATSRLALLMQNGAATLRYHHAARVDPVLSVRLAIPAIAGAGVGALIATRMSNESFRSVLAWVMLGCAAFVIAEPRLPYFRRAAGTAPRLGAGYVWPTLFLIGLYGGAVQAGVGYLILAALTLALNLPLVEANVQKVVLVFAYTPIVLLVFSSEGMIAWWPALVLTVGQAAGGWVGAQESLKRGEGFVRAVLAAVVAASAVKLLW